MPKTSYTKRKKSCAKRCVQKCATKKKKCIKQCPRKCTKTSRRQSRTPTFSMPPYAFPEPSFSKISVFPLVRFDEVPDFDEDKNVELHEDVANIGVKQDVEVPEFHEDVSAVQNEVNEFVNTEVNQVDEVNQDVNDEVYEDVNNEVYEVNEVNEENEDDEDEEYVNVKEDEVNQDVNVGVNELDQDVNTEVFQDVNTEVNEVNEGNGVNEDLNSEVHEVNQDVNVEDVVSADVPPERQNFTTAQLTKRGCKTNQGRTLVGAVTCPLSATSTAYPFAYKGEKFYSVEQFMLAQKASVHGDPGMRKFVMGLSRQLIQTTLNLETFVTKSLRRSFKHGTVGTRRWRRAREGLLTTANLAKFSAATNNDAAEFLVRTGDHELSLFRKPGEDFEGFERSLAFARDALTVHLNS